MKSIELNVFTNSTISSPSTEMIENTVLSFNRAFDNNIKIEVWCDPNPYLDNASLYITNLKKIFPVVNISKSLSEGYVRSIKKSNSDFIFMLEHDWEFLPTISHSLTDIIDLIYNEGITHFRFNKRSNVPRKFDTNLREIKHRYIPYCLTNGVSNNPHIIDRKKYIKEALKFIEISEDSRGIEKQLSNQGIRAAIYGAKHHAPTVLHKDGKRTRNLSGKNFLWSPLVCSVTNRLAKIFRKMFYFLNSSIKR